MPQSKIPKRGPTRHLAGSAARRSVESAPLERSLHTQLAGRLGREIVGGLYPSGSLLPNAVEMCARYSVSRTALREAYSVLAAKALIVARPKVGTRVRPKSDWNMLDPEMLSWHLQSVPTEDFVADLFVLRQMVEPAAAALAAAERSSGTLERITEAYGRMERFKNGSGDLIQADLDFHLGILEATGNHFLTALGGLNSSVAGMHLQAQLGGRGAHTGRSASSTPGNSRSHLRRLGGARKRTNGRAVARIHQRRPRVSETARHSVGSHCKCPTMNGRHVSSSRTRGSRTPRPCLVCGLRAACDGFPGNPAASSCPEGSIPAFAGMTRVVRGSGTWIRL